MRMSIRVAPRSNPSLADLIAMLFLMKREGSAKIFMIKTAKGTKDVEPSQSYQWHFIEQIIREITSVYGFREIRTPVFEHTELFLRSVGDTTDIVNKEMYIFTDKGGRSMTLKPEGTAGVVRSFIEHSGYADAQPTKMYYCNCPVFRYERPQAGRLREHHQFGAELFGAQNASADAEMISMANSLFERLGISQLILHINNIGCKKCRPGYHEALRNYFAEHIQDMCADCQSRFEKNPLRILDCKNEKCRVYIEKAPIMLDYACEECKDHFESLQEYLNALGVPFEIDPYIVRGLDYYTKTVFEFISTHIGAQGTVCGGGRYDDLIEELGGPATPAIGFGMGMERLLLVMEGQGLIIPEPLQYDLYIASMGAQANMQSATLASQLRAHGIKVQTDLMDRSIKAQMKYANKLQIPYVVVIGENELEEGVVQCKTMEDGSSQSIALGNFVDEIRALIKPINN